VEDAKTRLIAVEDCLTPVAQALRDRGYAVTAFDKGRLGQVDAVVVSGQDETFMGISTVQTRAPVISAEGRSAEEVVREVERRLRTRPDLETGPPARRQ